jgi:hypothetical protein
MESKNFGTDKRLKDTCILMTGFSIYASFDSIYQETGWDTLSTRRKVKKFLPFYKIVNKEAPGYLYELVPPSVAANVNYNLRRKLNIFFQDNPFLTCI